MLEAARLDEVVEQAVRTLEFSVLAKYAFGLAQMFNAFYHRYPILNEERDDVRRWRAAAVSYFRTQLRGARPDGDPGPAPNVEDNRALSRTDYVADHRHHAVPQPPGLPRSRSAGPAGSRACSIP